MNRNALAVLCAMLVLLLSTVAPLTELEDSGTRLLGQEEENDQSVTLVRPVGGESYNASESVDILFSNAGLTEVLIELKLDRESSWSTLGTRAMEPDTSSWWVWEVPNHPSTTAQVRVSSPSAPEIVDTGDYFTIVGDVVEPPENIAVISPNGGESYFVDDTMIVEWNGSGYEVVDIWYAVSRGPWMIIERSVENTGSYDWVVPDAASDEAQIKVCVGGEAVAEDVCDFNDDFFEILPRPPCTPLGWWDNTTAYDTRDTVLYPPPLAMAWVSLVDNNTDFPQESENGHDSWVRCNHRGSSTGPTVADFRSDFVGVMNLADASIRYSFDGENLEHLIGMDGTDVAGKEIVFARNTTIGESKGVIEEDDGMHQGSMNSIRNIRAGIWIPDVNGDLDFCIHVQNYAGDIYLDGACKENGTYGVGLESVPPIVVSDCNEGALAEVGVLISEGAYDSGDVAGHLTIDSSGAAPAPQCGAVVTIAATDLPILEEASGTEGRDVAGHLIIESTGIFNYVENDDDTFTLVYTYPGLTCDAFEVGAGDWESGTEGRATAIEYALIVALIAVGICDDVVTQIETIVLDEDDFSHIDDFTGGVTCTCNPGACVDTEESRDCGEGDVSGVYVGKEGTDVAGVEFIYTDGDTSTGGCWTDSDGLATWKDDCGEGDVAGVLSVSEHPPIVTGDCNDEMLAEVGVFISNGMYASLDVGGHLLVQNTGIAEPDIYVAGDLVLRGMVCGAQVSVTIDGIHDNVIYTADEPIYMRHARGVVPNFIHDEENNQTTFVYSYPGMTCDAAGVGGSHSYVITSSDGTADDDGTDARSAGRGPGDPLQGVIISLGVATCEDVVVEVEGPVNGSRSNISDDECLGDEVDGDCVEVRDEDVILSVGSVDVTPRDAVAVGGGVAGTSILWLAGRKLLGGA